jgi:hypothetical protein
MINDFVAAKGALVITLYDAQGIVKEERRINNLVTSVGKAYIAGMLGPTPPAAMDYMGVGTGVTPPAIGDTVLQTEIGTRALLTVTQTGGTPTVTYAATFGPGNGTGALTEAGLFNALTVGTMMAHTTFASVNKAASDTITITWSLTIQ